MEIYDQNNRYLGWVPTAGVGDQPPQPGDLLPLIVAPGEVRLFRVIARRYPACAVIDPTTHERWPRPSGMDSRAFALTVWVTDAVPLAPAEAERFAWVQELLHAVPAEAHEPEPTVEPEPEADESDIFPLPVAPEGTLVLTPELRQRLGVANGGHVFVRQTPKTLCLLSGDEIMAVASGRRSLDEC